MPRFIEKQYKSIINKNKIIDHWFWTRYSINPYNGCQFGCIYCDARSDHYHMPEDFENEIVIKTNVGEVLDQRLTRARTFLPDVVGMGGVTDSYQPAEKKYENTRSILQVLARHQYPVHIFTKSTLVLRDLPLLEEIAQQTWCTVSVTITTIDPDKSIFLDKFAPAPAKRLDVLRQIKANAPHVQTGALLIPLVPFLGDDPKEVADLFTAVKETNTDYLMFGGAMTLRNRQADWFLRHLREAKPDVYQQYAELYQFTPNAESYDGRYVPTGDYIINQHEKLLALSQKHDLPHRIKRYIPNDWRKTNYKIAERMLNVSYERQMLGQSWEKLFWAAQNIQNLKEPIEAVAARGELGHIKNVRGHIKRRIEDILANKIM
ncbi:radical SAM protein [Candidatus Leptofilum sp.]|uniref:SPL family radical SAM protein n=1 Tax=Candidatus Leptofilum sp. TaxID=3241576 RepID=UPI003B5C90F2